MRQGGMTMYDMVPNIDIGGLPDDERESARFVFDNIMGISSASKKVDYCIRLIKFSNEKHGELHANFRSGNPFSRPDIATTMKQYMDDSSVYHCWGGVGARHAVMLIYGIWMTMQAINGILKDCPTLMFKMNMPSKKAAQQLFLKSFPDIAKLRLTAAHPGEFAITPKKADHDAVIDGVESSAINVGKGARLLIEGGMMEGDYISTVGGKLVKCKIGQETVDVLDKLNGHIFDTFNVDGR
jgi:hypothetical protein